MITEGAGLAGRVLGSELSQYPLRRRLVLLPVLSLSSIKIHSSLCQYCRDFRASDSGSRHNMGGTEVASAGQGGHELADPQPQNHDLGSLQPDLARLHRNMTVPTKTLTPATCPLPSIHSLGTHGERTRSARGFGRGVAGG
jgi:hypothetical protein